MLPPKGRFLLAQRQKFGDHMVIPQCYGVQKFFGLIFSCAKYRYNSSHIIQPCCGSTCPNASLTRILALYGAGPGKSAVRRCCSLV
jgi:hypothetical protein